MDKDQKSNIQATNEAQEILNVLNIIEQMGSRAPV